MAGRAIVYAGMAVLSVPTVVVSYSAFVDLLHVGNEYLQRAACSLQGKSLPVHERPPPSVHSLLSERWERMPITRMRKDTLGIDPRFKDAFEELRDDTSQILSLPRVGNSDSVAEFKQRVKLDMKESVMRPAVATSAVRDSNVISTQLMASQIARDSSEQLKRDGWVNAVLNLGTGGFEDGDEHLVLAAIRGVPLEISMLPAPGRLMSLIKCGALQHTVVQPDEQPSKTDQSSKTGAGEKQNSPETGADPTHIRVSFGSAAFPVDESGSACSPSEVQLAKLQRRLEDGLVMTSAVQDIELLAKKAFRLAIDRDISEGSAGLLGMTEKGKGVATIRSKD